MVKKDQIEKIRYEFQEGMGLAKCRKCQCMKETLENLCSSLSSLQTAASSDLLENVESWVKQMEPITYPCSECEHCFPAVAMNVLNRTFPETAGAQSPSCGSKVREQTLPPAAGESSTSCDGTACLVAVSTLASAELAETLADRRPEELCMVGKTETENLGIENVIKNMVKNPMIRVLLVVGKDPEGHYSGKTLLALCENGVDENMRVIGSPGKRPVLSNVTGEEVDAFRKQVQVVDMIGCEDVEQIIGNVKELSNKAGSSNICKECREWIIPVQSSITPLVKAKKPAKVEMDRAGYFVIVPQQEKGTIVVEHYSYNNKRQRVIEGEDASSIYQTIIENGWVTQLSHAAYLGKELANAQLSIKQGFKYVQDGS